MPYVDTIYNIHSYIHIDKTHTYIYIYIIKHDCLDFIALSNSIIKSNMYNNNNNKNKLTVSNPIWMLCIYIFCSLILNSVDGKTTTLVFPTNNLKPEDIGWKVIDYVRGKFLQLFFS